ncbi:MAG: glycosyltransferase [Paracoccus sp. (in: a-proteobacteria)]|nr:glycosyltransferase [Paracoccus sp. (in: a-proteobacteria)]
MSDPAILGICRFSYLGQSDFAAFRGRPERTPAFLNKVAADLYADQRMIARFRAFETLCLPSVLAQQQPGFVFLIVTSPQMPKNWLTRLDALCQGHDELQLVVSEATDLSQALLPALQDMHDASGGNFIQFRLDDDDALAVDYIARLRTHAQRMKGIDQFAICFARGVQVALYPGQATQYLSVGTPFLSAGLAVRMANPARSIFTVPHLRTANRFTSLIVHDTPAALQLRWPSDSRPLDPDRLPPDTRFLPHKEWTAILQQNFPYLTGTDFEKLRVGGATDPPPTGSSV